MERAAFELNAPTSISKRDQGDRPGGIGTYLLATTGPGVSRAGNATPLCKARTVAVVTKRTLLDIRVASAISVMGLMVFFAIWLGSVVLGVLGGLFFLVIVCLPLLVVTSIRRRRDLG